MVQCHTNACTCSSILRRTHRIEWRDWGTSLEEEMREHFGSACFLSHWHSNLRGTQPRRLNGRKPKKKRMAQEAPVLTNDVPPQRLYRTPSPLQVHFFALFCRVTQRSHRIIGWITKCWKRFSLVSGVDKCGMWSQGHTGKCSAVEFIVQSVLEINQAYSIYPASQCQDPRKGIKCTFFSVTGMLSSPIKNVIFFSLSGYFYGQSLLLS